MADARHLAGNRGSQSPEAGLSPLLIGLVATVVLAGAIGMVRWYQLRDEARSRWEEQLGALAAVTRSTIGLWQRERMEEIGRASAAIEEGDVHLVPGGRLTPNAFLSTILAHTSNVAAWVLGPDDSIVARYGADLALTNQLAELADQARTDDMALQSPLLLGDTALLMVFATPIRQPAGMVLLHAADPRPVILTLLEGHPKLVGTEQYRAVAQVGGRVVVISPDSEPAMWIRPVGDAAPSSRLAVGGRDTFASMGTPGGREMLAAVRPMAGDSWGVVGRIPYRDAMARADRQALAEGAGLLALGGLLSLGAFARRRREQVRLLRQQQAQEERYRTVVSQASDGILITDTDLRLIDLNPAACRALGIGAEALLGAPITDLFPPDQRDERSLRVEAMRAGQTVVLERRLLRADGSMFEAELAMQLLPDGRCLAVVRDLTDRRSAQAAVEHSLSLLQATLDSTADGILVVDRKGHITTFNARFAEMWGLPESLLKAGDDEAALAYVLPRLAYPDRFLERVKELYANPDDLSSDIITFKDGRVFERTSRPQRLGDDIVGRVWTFHDLTEQAATAETVRRSEGRYRGLFDNAVFGIYRSTKDGRFLSVNPALVHMLGYDRADELLSLNSIATAVYADPAERDRLIALYAGTGRIDGVTTQWRRRNGSLLYVRLRGRPVVTDDGSVDGFEMFVEDVTDRRELEEQLRQAQKMEAVGQLTGGIAHDFNNLLTAILAGSELLSLESGAREDSEEIRAIRDAALKGGALVRKLMTVSRSAPLDLAVVDPVTLVRDMEALLQRLLPATIHVVMEEGVDVGAIRADRGALEQILLNLATNARDAMPDGGTLTLALASVDLAGAQGREPGRYVRLTVGDTGIGMDDRTRQRMFEPFFTTKEAGRGTGLGMAMVYGLVKQHNGMVDVESAPGEGTAVHVLFLEAEPLIAGIGAPPEADLPRGHETILLVEDEDIVRRTTPKVLERFGYTVHVAADGVEALEVLTRREPPIDLVLTDLVMPRMGGKALYEAARALPHPPRFMFTSGHIKDEVGLAGHWDEDVPFLRKPWSLHSLLARVREALD